LIALDQLPKKKALRQIGMTDFCFEWSASH